jgi:cold shock CspA family protein
METPIEIDSAGVQLPAHIAEVIDSHVRQLERRYGRITDGRVTVRSPSQHHRSGGLYEVHIHLSLPNGMAVNVDRVSQVDERRADLRFAVDNAFKRARRQLQDRVRKLQGQTKHHDGQPVGTVLRLDTEGGFGFLASSEGHDVYFHRNSIVDGSFDELRPGARVAYAEEAGEKGPQASSVRPIGKHRLA